MGLVRIFKLKFFVILLTTGFFIHVMLYIYGSQTTTEDEGENIDPGIRNSNRIKVVQEFCKHNHLGIYSYSNGSNFLGVKDPPTPQYSYFYVNRQYHLAWCPVYKSGSTSFLHNMILLAGFSDNDLLNPPKQLSIWAKEAYGEIGPGLIFDSSMKLLVVRHPFERILSAYKDKLSNASIGIQHGTEHFYHKYGEKIVRKYRKDKTIQRKEPTFQEFVEYLIHTDLINYADDHWLPAYYACTPCRVNYNFIAKTETYNSDQQYIISSMNLNIILKPKWKHKSSGINEHNSKVYFSQLTKTQISQLYHKYFLDFQLFNYSHVKYLEFGKD